MKSALLAIGSLALGAGALYLLDPTRRRARGRLLPLAYSGPLAAVSGRTRRTPEPGEIEEFVGTPTSGPSAG